MGRRSEKPLVEKIRVHLEEQIIAGRLKPRQRLVEEEIAREMSVSRSPIREALRALEREGLVTLTPGRGACVADLTLEEVDDVYAVRVPRRPGRRDLGRAQHPAECMGPCPCRGSCPWFERRGQQHAGVALRAQRHGGGHIHRR
jgi:DNA-binding transcriptional MocR family regulator